MRSDSQPILELGGVGGMVLPHPINIQHQIFEARLHIEASLRTGIRVRKLKILAKTVNIRLGNLSRGRILLHQIVFVPNQHDRNVLGGLIHHSRV